MNARNHISSSGKTAQSAWVVFSGYTDIAWLKILKPGFRHCFVLLNDGQRWISIDPISPYTDVQVYHHVKANFNLPKSLEEGGNKIVPAIIEKNHKKAAPWMLFTCVEAIKRILGIHKRFIFTPWQLYQFLEKSKRQKTKYLKGDISWEF